MTPVGTLDPETAEPRHPAAAPLEPPGHDRRPPAATLSRMSAAVAPAAPFRPWVGVALVAAAGVAFGLQNVLAKVSYDHGADVPTVLAIRFGVAAAALLALQARLANRPSLPAAPPDPIPLGRRLAIAGLGLLFVGNALFAYLALARLPASTTTLLVFAYPALVVLWSRLFFHEPITGRRLAALAVALGGCALMVNPWTTGEAAGNLDWVGVAWAAGSALTNSWHSTLAGPIGRGLPGRTVAAGSLPVTALCFGLGLAALGGPAGAIDPAGWLACLAIGLLAGLSITAFLAGVSRIGPSRAAIVATSEPAAALAFGTLLLGERLSAATLAGALAVAAAIALIAGGPRPAPLGKG